MVAASVLFYKCYYSRRGNTRPLSSAIRRGLKESGTSKVPTTSKNSKPLSPVKYGEQHDATLPEKRGKRSPTDTYIDPQTFKTQVYQVNEKEGLVSPTEKEISLREKGIDEQKMMKLGHLYFTVKYDAPKTALMVSILKATDLPAKDMNQESSDPYIKLQLLPEKRHKVKTRVLRKTLNPTYDEIFTFYGIDNSLLQAITLHFVVLSFDRFSRDEIIGEVLYPLNGVDVNEQEFSTCKEILPRHIKVSFILL